MNDIYILTHNYNRSTYDIENKMIGVYSSYANAVDELKRYMLLDGFKEHPTSCFSITKYTLNACYWRDGFISKSILPDLPCDIPFWAREETPSLEETPDQFVKRILSKYEKNNIPIDDLPCSEQGSLKRYASMIIGSREEEI